MGKAQQKQKLADDVAPVAADSAERFTGHESFACRYGWIPKLYELASIDGDLLGDDERVMVKLGIGRNMAKSIRFWGTAFGLTTGGVKAGYQITEFATWLLSPKTGEDPFLEDVGTYWLLHWRLTARANIGAWNVVFFDTPEREILYRFLIQKVERRAELRGDGITPDTARAHVDVFLDCYAAPAQRLKDAPRDDVLSCPLQELGLITLSPTGANDELVELHRGPWPNLDAKTFLRIVLDFWEWNAAADRTLSMRSLLVADRSPGLVLRLDESAMVEMLRKATEQYPKIIGFSESLERRAVELKSKSLAEAKRQVNYL